MAEPKAPTPPLGWTDLSLLSVVVAFAINFRMGQLAGVFDGGGRLDPSALLLLRILLVVPPLLWIAARATGKPIRQMVRLEGEERWLMPAMGFIAIVGNQFFFLWGMQHTNTVHAALLFALSPGLGAVFVRWFVGERTGTRLWAGIALAFAGVALVVSNAGAGGPSRSDAEPTVFGDLLILGAATGWALYSTGSARAVRHRTALEVTALTMFYGLGFGLVLFGPSLLHELRSGSLARVSPAGAGALLYLAYGGALYGWIFWTRGIEAIGAGRTMLYQYLVPVCTMVAGVTFFGETLDLRACLGGALILLGVGVGRT